MRQQRITVPVIGGAAGYIIPDFEKGLGEFAENVLSISPTNYDLARGAAGRTGCRIVDYARLRLCPPAFSTSARVLSIRRSGISQIRATKTYKPPDIH
jgi:hypothetical protein